MGIIKDPPPFDSEKKPFVRYKTEVKTWTLVTEVPENKWALVLALSLPEDDKSGIRNKVFDSLGEQKLKGKDGYQEFMKFLEKEFGEDEIYDVFNKFEEFESCRKKQSQSMQQYLSAFELLYTQVKNKGFPELPQEYLMFKVIKNSGLTENEVRLVQTDIDYDRKDKLFDSAKAGLVKYFGRTKDKAEKVDNKTFALNEGNAGDEEAFYGGWRDRSGTFPGGGDNRYGGSTNFRGGYRNGGGFVKGGFKGNGEFQNRGQAGFGGGQGQGWSGGGQGGSRGQRNAGFQGRGGHANYANGEKPRKQINPLDQNGVRQVCSSCGSYRHLLKDCPDSWENMNKNVLVAEESRNKDMKTGEGDDYGIFFSMNEEEHSVLYTGNLKEENVLLVAETKNKALIDTGCSATVAGQDWAKILVGSLSRESQAKVEKLESAKTFRFGGGERRKSLGFWRIPCKIAGKNVMLETDVVEADIPCLLSKAALKRAGTVLKLETDQAEIFGRTIDLESTSSGHYALQILDVGENHDEVLIAELGVDYERKEKEVVKIHKQFAHPSRRNMEQLLKDSRNMDDDVCKILDKIYSKCVICLQFASTRPRPSVGMPMGRDFNDCVAMDLKIYQKQNLIILYLIDVFTRYTFAAIIKDKKADTVIDVVVKNWVLGPFGPPRRFLADNGGEFANEKYRDMCENLNIEVLKTGAESPFQNGLCERNHAVVDGMLEKLIADNPEIDLDIALASAVCAKNSLAMNNGFSPIQLVTGKNPTLPSVLSDNPPALEARSISQAFNERVNAALSARAAFIEVDASARVRRALLKKITMKTEVYHQGDKVFFRRGNDRKWHGPGTVIGVDGKVIFVKHGRLYITTSPTRLLKTNKVFEKCGEEIDKLGPVIEHHEIAKTANNMTTKNDTESSDDEEETRDEDEPGRGMVDTPDVNPTQLNVDNEAPALGVNRENNRIQNLRSKYPKANDKISCLLGEGDEAQWFNVEVMKKGGKSTAKNKDYFNVKYNDDSVGGIHLDKVPWRYQPTVQRQEVGQIDEVPEGEPGEAQQDVAAVEGAPVHHEIVEEPDEEVYVVAIPRNLHHSKPVLDAKRKELENFKIFNVYEPVEDSGQQRIRTGWVITEKMFGNVKGVKARLVARGNEEMQAVRTDSPTIGKSTLRIQFAVAAQLEWKIECSDVTAAFLQGESLTREVFVIPPPEAKEEGKIWKLLKPVYGLDDACRNFYLKAAEKLIQYGCKRSKLDSALFLYFSEGKLEGFVAAHVDDLIHAGTDMFKSKVMEPLRKFFKFGSMSKEAFKYVGWSLNHEGGNILVDQKDYVDEKIETIEIDAQRRRNRAELLSDVEMESFRSGVGKGRWLTDQTRPDCSYDELELSMMTRKATVNDILKLNKMFLKLKQDSVIIKYKQLGRIDELKLSVFSDASYGNLPDGESSGMGFLIFLSTGFTPGNISPCSLLSWTACKVQRKVSSTCAAETLSLLAALEQAIVIRHQISEILNKNPKAIKIEAFIDNNDAYEAIYSTKQMMKGRLRIDIGAIKEMIENKEVEAVAWIPAKYQLADCLTKRGASTRSLLQTINTGMFPSNTNF